MSRALVVLLVICGFAIPVLAATYTGALDEVVPWPMLSAGIPMRRLLLEDKPLEELTGRVCPDGHAGTVLYGLLPLGSGLDPGISIAVWLGEEIRILVDTDNDEDLSDESGIYSRERILARAFTWFVTVTPEYESRDRVIGTQYALTITASYSHATDTYEFLYGGFCHRRGSVEIDGQIVPIAMTSQVSTGLYDDLSTLLVSIDADGDGSLDTLPGSHEVFPPGEPLQIGTQVYRLVSVSQDGRRVTLEELGVASTRLPIRRGEAAPDFAGRTLDGQIVRLSDYRGKIVVLILEQGVSTACPGCTSVSLPTSAGRSHAVRQVLWDRSDEVEILSVFPGGHASEEAQDLQAGEGVITILSDEARESYRRRAGLFLLDRDLTIVAMDEPWATVRCGRPMGKMDLLNEMELRQTIDRLLAEEDEATP